MSRLLIPVSLLMLSLISFYARGVEALPRHNESALIQRVTLPAIPDGVNVWDFSQVDYAASPVEVSFVWTNDSCLSAWLPGIRYDYTLSGDTIFHTATETHFMVLADTIPMPYATTVRSAAISSAYASRGRAYHTEYISALGEMALMPVTKGTVILPAGDTIADVTLTRHSSSMFIAAEFRRTPEIDLDSIGTLLHRTTVTHSWTSPDFTVPVAQITEVIDSVGSQQRGYPTVTAWICPPENQPISAAVNNLEPKSHRARHTSSDGSLAPISDLTVNVTDNAITVSGTAAAGGPIEIVLTDIIGRVFSSAPHNDYAAGANVEWSCGNLPSGQYLLHISSGDQNPVTHKIIIK